MNNVCFTFYLPKDLLRNNYNNIAKFPSRFCGYYLSLNYNTYPIINFRAAICCLGGMYEKLGRMMGRSYEETVTTLVRSLKSADSQTRLEIMNTLEKVSKTPQTTVIILAY